MTTAPIVLVPGFWLGTADPRERRPYRPVPRSLNLDVLNGVDQSCPEAVAVVFGLDSGGAGHHSVYLLAYLRAACPAAWPARLGSGSRLRSSCFLLRS